MASGLTPTYLIPYPLSTDPVNVHGDIEDLADRIETLLPLFAREDELNTFIQPNVFNVNSTSTAVRITQTGTGNALLVEDEANPDSSPFIITGSGDVGIGVLSPSEKLDIAGNIKTTGNIIFEGTEDANELILTAGDPAGDYTVTIPGKTGTIALTNDKLSAFAATTSAELAGVISDETGTGALVFGSSPTISTPTLTLSTTTSTTAGRLARTNSTLRLGNGTTALTFSDDSVIAATYAPLTSPTLTGLVTINTPNASTIGLSVKGFASQTANLQEWQTSAGTAVASIGPSGIISLATWQGNAIGPTYGGTGLTSYTAGDVIYSSASNTLSKLGIGTTGQLLTVSGGLPVWADAPISLPSQTGNAGELLVTDGTTASWSNTVIANSSSTIGLIVQGVASQSAALQVWQNSSGVNQAIMSASGTLSLNNNLNVPGLAAIGGSTSTTVQALIISNSATRIGNIVRGAASQTANLTEWQNSASTVVASIGPTGIISSATWQGNAVTPIYGGTGLSTYTTGDILYSSTTNTLAKLGIGSTGQVLTVTGGVPVWAAAPVSLPDQTGNGGKYLTTDGTTASWVTISTSQSFPQDSEPVSPTEGTIWLDTDGTVLASQAELTRWTRTATASQTTFDGLADGATVTVTNLITNPSFETNTTDWVRSGGTSFNRITTDSVFGSACGEYLATSSSSNIMSIDASVTASQIYTFSVYVKGEAGKLFSIAIDERTGSTSVGTTFSTNITANGSWQRVSVTRTFGETGVVARCQIYNATSGAHTLRIDGAILTQASTVEPYFDGGTTGVNNTTFAWTGTANNSSSTKTGPALSSVKTNLVRNSNFELATTNYAGARITLSLDTVNVWNGAQALKGTINSTSAVQYIDNASMPPIAPSETYTFSAYVYLPATNTADSNLRVAMYPHTGSGFLAEISSSSVTVVRGAWTRLSVTGTMPSNAIQVMPRLISSTLLAIGQEIITDGWMIERGSPATTYFDGDTAGSGNTTYRWTGNVGLSQSDQLSPIAPTLGYEPGAEQVFLNGVQLIRGTDYSANNGTSVVLSSGASAGDILQVITFSPLQISNLQSQINTKANIAGDAFTGNISAPAIVPTGTTVPTNGMYLSASNTVALATNSTNRLSIASDGNTTISRNLLIGGGSGSFTAFLEIGSGRSADGAAYIDLITDTTYTDHGFRIIRNSSANGSAQISNRGTGTFDIRTFEAGAVTLSTNNTTRLTIESGGNAIFTGTVAGNASAASTAANGANALGFKGIPSSGSGTTGAYTITASDAGEMVYSTATRTVTIPANSSVPFEIGTSIVFISGSGTTTTIAITSDTLILAGSGTTGSRTLAAHGMATAVKVAATTWYISGNGLT